MPDQLRAQGRDEGARVRRQLPRPHAARRCTRRTRRASARRSSSPGYQCTFAPFPVWDARRATSRPRRAASTPRRRAATSPSSSERFGDAKDDALLAAEVASLAAVHEALATGEYFCAIIEPMQSEGGDRYATERFFRALRLLTRHHQTFLVFDEVQVGFGLGGPFAWHSKFRLLSARGQQDYPDAVTFAKRAQVGVVMSRFADPEPASAHDASLVRGRIHADMVSTSHNAERLEKLVAPRLAQIARAYPHLVQYPRATGYAFAFDLPTPALLDAFLGQRFWRGAIVFAAGTRTARYRLSATRSSRARSICCSRRSARSLSWLDAHDGKKPPEWEDQPVPAPQRRRRRPRSRYRLVPHGEAMDHLPAILDIEYQVYEPARRTPPAEIRAAIEDPEGSLIVAEAPTAGRRVAARRVRDRRAARAEQGRRGLRRRSDARQAQHDVLGVDHGRAELPELGHRPEAQGAAAARRGRAQDAPTARRAIATSPGATASAAPRR